MIISSSDKELLLVCLAKGLRTFGFGSVSVILALFLAKHNFTSMQVGAIFSATLIEDALFTTLVSLFANRLGLRKVLLSCSALMMLSGLCLGFTSQPWLIALAAVCGIFSPAGFEGGPFAAVEQTIIAREISADKLTRAFSWYNLTGFAGAALGSLLAGLCFARFAAVDQDLAYRIIFMLYIASSVVMSAIYAMLPKIDHRRNSPQSQSPTKDQAEAESGKINFRSLLSDKKAGALVLLQGVDAFGGGFVVQSLIAYWFYIRYHVGADFTGLIFCVANVLAAGSFLAAPVLATRIGLLKTMVFTHLPCSIALCFVPFMPTAQLAGALLLCRSLFSSMDIPARQAYTMLLVHPADRSAVAGMTSASRAIAQGLSPLLSGWATMCALSGMPFVIAGTCKTIYDICLYCTFRRIPLESASHSRNRQTATVE